jgi:hypothetical protein
MSPLTDQQLYLSIGIPGVIALAGILVNVGYFVALNGRMSSMELGLDGRINSLEAKIDMKFDLLTGKVIELDNRIIRLEERLKH